MAHGHPYLDPTPYYDPSLMAEILLFAAQAFLCRLLRYQHDGSPAVVEDDLRLQGRPFQLQALITSSLNFDSRLSVNSNNEILLRLASPPRSISTWSSRRSFFRCHFLRSWFKTGLHTLLLSFRGECDPHRPLGASALRTRAAPPNVTDLLDDVDSRFRRK